METFILLGLMPVVMIAALAILCLMVTTRNMDEIENYYDIEEVDSNVDDKETAGTYW